jgi:hypothetical protein
VLAFKKKCNLCNELFDHLITYSVPMTLIYKWPKGVEFCSSHIEIELCDCCMVEVKELLDEGSDGTL